MAGIVLVVFVRLYKNGCRTWGVNGVFVNSYYCQGIPWLCFSGYASKFCHDTDGPPVVRTIFSEMFSSASVVMIVSRHSFTFTICTPVFTNMSNLTTISSRGRFHWLWFKDFFFISAPNTTPMDPKNDIHHRKLAGDIQVEKNQHLLSFDLDFQLSLV